VELARGIEPPTCGLQIPILADRTDTQSQPKQRSSDDFDDDMSPIGFA